MKAEMTLEEAIAIADRYKRTNEGLYAQAFDVLADAIVTYSQRLEDAKRKIDEANDKISALQLDLGIKDQVHVGANIVNLEPRTKAQDSSVTIGGVQGKGGVF